MKKSAILLTVGLSTALLLTGCSGAQQASPPSATSSAEPTAEESTDPSTSAASESPTESSSETASPSSVTGTVDSSPSSDDLEISPSAPDMPSAETSGDVVLSTEKAGQPLVLGDFFNPDSDWVESRYDVADQGQVSGIGRQIDQCGGQNDNPQLELRLANRFKTLAFKVGQSNISKSTEQRMIVRVLGNNKQINVFAVPYNAVQGVTVPVKDVNALSIEFYLDDQMEGCFGSGGVQAVLYDVKLG